MEQTGKDPEHPMPIFTYKNYSKGHWQATLLFECEAESILEADELCKKATGIKSLEKAPHVGCSISKKVAYTFTCPGCGNASHKPGYCHPCTQDINAYYDWLDKTAPAPDPKPEDFEILQPL